MDEKVKLQVVRTFNDSKAKRKRIKGETFTEATERAEQLLNYKIPIVVRHLSKKGS